MLETHIGFPFVGSGIIDTLGYCLVCPIFFVCSYYILTSSVTSITEEMYGNREPIILLNALNNGTIHNKS